MNFFLNLRHQAVKIEKCFDEILSHFAFSLELKNTLNSLHISLTASLETEKKRKTIEKRKDTFIENSFVV